MAKTLNSCTLQLQNLKEGDHWRNLDVDGSII
jgi:hypothetical protein